MELVCRLFNVHNGIQRRMQVLILSQKVCAGRIRTNVPTPGYNIQSLFRILPQHTVALRCAKSLELPQNGFLRGNQVLGYGDLVTFGCIFKEVEATGEVECI